MSGHEDILDLLDIPDHIEANQDLLEYDQTQTNNPAPQRTQKPPEGPCAHCTQDAQRRCLRCERGVCRSHHTVMYGLCTPCMDEGTHTRDKKERSLYRDLGIHWIE